jgi:hypothetical protein
VDNLSQESQTLQRQALTMSTTNLRTNSVYGNDMQLPKPAVQTFPMALCFYFFEIQKTERAGVAANWDRAFSYQKCRTGREPDLQYLASIVFSSAYSLPDKYGNE